MIISANVDSPVAAERERWELRKRAMHWAIRSPLDTFWEPSYTTKERMLKHFQKIIDCFVERNRPWPKYIIMMSLLTAFEILFFFFFFLRKYFIVLETTRALSWNQAICLILLDIQKKHGDVKSVQWGDRGPQICPWVSGLNSENIRHEKKPAW